jgi:hypothetical protein
MTQYAAVQLWAKRSKEQGRAQDNNAHSIVLKTKSHVWAQGS